MDRSGPGQAPRQAGPPQAVAPAASAPVTPGSADDAAAGRRAQRALYAYNSDFRTYTLDATLVIAVTYLFSAIAVVILPFRKRELWAASPASKIKVLGVPIVPAAGWVTIALLVFNLFE